MALSRHHAAFSKPLSVEDIVREAQNFEYNIHRPLRQWLRAARMLMTEAAICEQEGNLSQAYLYLYRHAELVLAKLPEHPEYKDPQFKPELSQARKSLQRNLVKLEQWKPRINREHQHYAEAMERRIAERQRVQEEFNESGRQRYSYDASRRGSLASQGSVSPTRALDIHEHREFAVNLAQQEIRRRDASRRSTHEAGISPTTVAQRRQGIVNEDNYFGQIDKGTRDADRYFHQQQASRSRDQAAPSSSRQHTSTTTYHYPQVPQKQSRKEWDTAAPPYHAISPNSSYNTQKPPSVPSKEIFSTHQDVPPPIPARPQSSAQQAHQAPSKYTFAPTAYTESGNPLRTVLLPPDLRTSFLNLADSNTARNLETCGILAATVISGALFITHLIVPDQTSTSDTCDTTPEGDNALFDYCDSHNLLVCGWIHTHPSQSCFLSSRDLHTSSGYQVMLPEAIAIVCSPRHTPEWGIFRLTEPPGLEHVLNCTKPGIFHPHEEKNLYTDALKPGHVIEGPGLVFEVVDLRK
jgi:STAM-binding protein